MELPGGYAAGTILYYYKRDQDNNRTKLRVRIVNSMLNDPNMTQVEVLDVIEDTQGTISPGDIIDIYQGGLMPLNVNLNNIIPPLNNNLNSISNYNSYMNNNSFLNNVTNNNVNNGSIHNGNIQPNNNFGPLNNSSSPENTGQELTVPTGTETVILHENIQSGNRLINWTNENSSNPESFYQRYYKESEYNSLPSPKKNPVTRKLIKNPKRYTATVSGGKRKANRTKRSKTHKRSSKRSSRSYKRKDASSK